MIYFDNAATSFPKPKNVITAINECIYKYCGNSGRSSHKLALAASEIIYETREKIAQFVGAKAPEQVVFTYNATHALNLAIKTTIPDDSHVLISNMEHNSVFRPIYSLSKNKGVKYSFFNTNETIVDDIESKIREDTKCIVSTIASNVTGREIPLSILSEIARKHKISLIVDASQYIGHKTINIEKDTCDVLCAPSHKALFGIQGAGFCIFSDDKQRQTLFEGGSGSLSREPDMPAGLPERFEAGTLSTPCIASILAGINFIESVGISEIQKKLDALTEALVERLLSINNIIVYEYDNGVISFNLKNVPSAIITAELDKDNICTRGGLHCSPLAHETIRTLESGTVRVSFSYFNKLSEVDTFFKSLSNISKKY